MPKAWHLVTISLVPIAWIEAGPTHAMMSAEHVLMQLTMRVMESYASVFQVLKYNCYYHLSLFLWFVLLS